MFRIKDRSELSMNAFMVCMISGCDQESEKLWSTETNVIDVCLQHYTLLQNEAFLT